MDKPPATRSEVGETPETLFVSVLTNIRQDGVECNSIWMLQLCQEGRVLYECKKKKIIYKSSLLISKTPHHRKAFKRADL